MRTTLAAFASVATVASLPTYPNADGTYHTTVYLGSKSQPINVTIDTGSSMLVVLSSDYKECRNAFNATKSTTYSQSNVAGVAVY